MGSLGDMLQPVGWSAGPEKHGRPVIVFCNSNLEIFDAMPEVFRTIPILDYPELITTKSVADLLDLFLDVRYVSRAYGPLRRIRPLLNGGGGSMTLGDRVMLGFRPWVFIPRPPCWKALGFLLTTWTQFSRWRRPSISTGTLSPFRRAPPVPLGSSPVPPWAAVIAEIPLPCVQVGASTDPLIEGIQNQLGKGVQETASILKRAKCLISIENGIVHLARAVGTKAVVVFGPTPTTSFAYPENVNLGKGLCYPCFYAPTWGYSFAISEPSCVNFPAPSEVAKAAIELANALNSQASSVTPRDSETLRRPQTQSKPFLRLL